MKYNCDIIVVTWNQKETIKSFVESFLENTYTHCRMIIIDNASTDESVNYLLSLKDSSSCQFKIILNKENKGFVSGVNQGIAVSDAPYVCWANNDLIFYPGWLEEILSILERNPKIGVISPNSNSLGARPAKGMSIPSFAAELSKKYKGLFIEMPFCVGFCLVARRELIDKIGGLSENFAPLYFEDTDYSMSAKKAGYLIGAAKASYVWHQEHASFRQMGKKQQEIFSKNREVFRKKWGRILRIAWIVYEEGELKNDLSGGINLARQGNFVFFLVKNLKQQKEDIFKNNSITEHSGINFLKFPNNLKLFWRLMIKKKRYDLIIIPDSAETLRFLFRKLNYPVVNPSEAESRAQTIKNSFLVA